MDELNVIFKTDEHVENIKVEPDLDVYRCEQCDFTAYEKQRFVSHQRSHIEEETLMCNFCDFLCLEPTSMADHIQIRHSETSDPFTCSSCEYRALTKQNLVRHLIVHTGKKPFACELCPYTATTKQNLIRHRQVHSGEKKYACPVCDYRGGTKQNLLRHQGTHSSKVELENNYCYVCNENFSTKYSYNKHMECQHNL